MMRTILKLDVSVLSEALLGRVFDSFRVFKQSSIVFLFEIETNKFEM
jgi:hypothetical protein